MDERCPLPSVDNEVRKRVAGTQAVIGYMILVLLIRVPTTVHNISTRFYYYILALLCYYTYMYYGSRIDYLLL